MGCYCVNRCCWHPGWNEKWCSQGPIRQRNGRAGRNDENPYLALGRPMQIAGRDDVGVQPRHQRGGIIAGCGARGCADEGQAYRAAPDQDGRAAALPAMPPTMPSGDDR